MEEKEKTGEKEGKYTTQFSSRIFLTGLHINMCTGTHVRRATGTDRYFH